MGAVCITIIASISEPSDFLGLPIPDGKGGMSYASPAWAIEANRLAADGKVVIVFFDELTTCPPSVQAAMLRVVHGGASILGPTVVTGAEINPSTWLQRASTRPVSSMNPRRASRVDLQLSPRPRMSRIGRDAAEI